MKTEIEHCRHFDAEKCDRLKSCPMLINCNDEMKESSVCLIRLCHGCIKTWDFDDHDEFCDYYED